MTSHVALRPSERRLVVVCFLAFLFCVADVLTGGPLTAVDHWIRDLVQPGRPTPAWMSVVGDLGELGVSAALMMIVGVVVAQLAGRLWPLVLVVSNFAVTETLLLVVKAAVGRPGPGGGNDRPGYPGYFPSGHTATAAVCAGTLAFVLVAWAAGTSRIDGAGAFALGVGLLLGAVTAVDSVLGDFHLGERRTGRVVVGGIGPHHQLRGLSYPSRCSGTVGAYP